jgi:radical SAM protein with 4Fe4S-binding SPASM domain
MKRPGIRSLPIIGQRLERGVRVARAGARLAKTYVEHSLSEEWFTPDAVPRVSFETTNVCNAKCVFCANTVMERRKQMMDMEVFRKAVDEAAAFGVNEINFNVTIGDPLLDKRLLERARYVRQNHPRFKTLGFVTTLQWLHLFDIDEFMDAGFTWVSCSVTLSGRDQYREFFGVDCYDQVLRNLATLADANERRGRPMYILLTIKPTNEPLDAIKAHPDFIRMGEVLKRDLTPCIEAMGTYFTDWGGAVQLPDHLKKRPIIPRWYRPCRFLYQTLMVYSNGNVGACNCQDFEANSELILGNIANTTVQEIWEGDRLKEIRENWRKRNEVPDICRGCRQYVY